MDGKKTAIFFVVLMVVIIILVVAAFQIFFATYEPKDNEETEIINDINS